LPGSTGVVGVAWNKASGNEKKEGNKIKKDIKKTVWGLR